MSATEVVEMAPAEPAEPAAEEKVPEEVMPTEEKPAMDKKKTRAPRTPKERKPKSSKPANPSHPPYFQMIKDAILALNEKTGSSSYAIAKHMEESYKGVLPASYKKVLAVQLRNFAAKGKLVKVKASFKLAESGEEVVVVKKVKATAAAAAKRKTRSVASLKAPTVAKGKRTAGVKKAKKKAVPVKAKQPKSIKAPGANKAKAAA